MQVALCFPGCHRRAGVERIVFECANYLASRDHDVTVFANDWEPSPRATVKYQHVRVVKKPFFLEGPSYYRACTEAVGRSKFDVLNAHGCICPTGGVHWVQSVQKAWLERCRTFRPPLSWGRIRQRLNPLHPLLLQLEERHFSQRRYKKVIATTNEVKADLMRLYSVPENDIVIVPNGFSPDEFNPERRLARRKDQREKLGLASTDRVLLFVANELERKGYATILSALRELRRPDLKLIVAGKPPKSSVQALAAEFGLADSVIAYGSCSSISDLHSASDLFVLPTQYEAFCLAILEALGSGLPVVTTRVPGAADAIQVGVNGLLIEDPKSGPQLAAALQEVLEPERLDALASRAGESVAKYRWPSVLARYEQVLKEHCH
jgi:UDP-glucose:(heptosyl)LPS alpha-1,3-glucosyltransferase